MVKNTNGGKHKGIARKFAKANAMNALSEIKTRVVSNPDDEAYAQVTKKYGGSECQVVTQDQRSIRCHIRGKFTGKYKRSNNIDVGSYVLVGFRDWERKQEIKNVDLLHVYLPHDVQFLQTLHASFFNNTNIDTNSSSSRHSLSSSSSSSCAYDNDVIFSLSAPSSYHRLSGDDDDDDASSCAKASNAVGGGSGGDDDDLPDFSLI